MVTVLGEGHTSSHGAQENLLEKKTLAYSLSTEVLAGWKKGSNNPSTF